MTERDFRCNICGHKHTGTSAPYECSICGSHSFKYLTSEGKQHKRIWEL